MTTDEAIRGWVERSGQSVVDLTAELVRFRTVNKVTTGTELGLQRWLEALLREELGLETDLFSPEDVEGLHAHPGYFPGKDYTDRPNVVGIWRGAGNAGGQSLLFSSHVDSAPVAMGWETDPWDPVQRDGRLYGLGAYDMKGGLAASIMAVRCLQELGIRLKGDVLIESVVDEEFGGANGTLACRLRGCDADAAIVPEPTNMAVCPATRGGALWRFTFRGRSGMSFGGESFRNPVIGAARFISFLEQFEGRRSEEPGPAPWYEHNRSLPVIVTRVEAGDMSAPLCDSGPAECHVDVWVECYPDTTEEQLLAEVLTQFRRYGERIGSGQQDEPEARKMIRFLPGTQLDPDCPLIALLAEEVGNVRGAEAEVFGAPFACDAFMFGLYSRTPAVILGPSGGNAHAAGEYVDIASLLELVQVYARTIIKWCGAIEEDGSSSDVSRLIEKEAGK
ncbi:M20/M25/M40 family metallo-hydrolase [Paenibacillus silvisoli]|uniref:M20/M25/M40 family metallo-hydrolase n=1 Tax=Paenibacillus silvisoli TaxID=3110539 RepID=UPI0028062C7A|nr:M20/M25/M40 family metallo-hydrolase [Paenibacillus silvisoli]